MEKQRWRHGLALTGIALAGAAVVAAALYGLWVLAMVVFWETAKF